MPQKTPPKSNVKRSPASALACIACVMALALAAVVFAPATRGQGGNRNRPQGEQGSRPKAKLTPLRGSETTQGSQLTITSTEPLNNYSAYRSGDKFYVRIPNADAGAVRGGIRGRGFEDAQVQKQGEDVILSFRVQPGARPRVNQRFNKLDVVFAAPAGQESGTQPGEQRGQTGETRNPTPAPTQQQQQPAQPSGTTTAQGTTPDRGRNPVVRDTPPAAEQQPQQQSSAAPTQPPAGDPGQATVPPPSAETQGTPAATGTPAEAVTQVADARRPEGAGAPVNITTGQPAGQTGTAFGAAVLRNWPLALIATLLLVGLGLFLAARRSSAAKRAGEPATPYKLEESDVAEVSKPRKLVTSKAEPLRKVEEVASVTPVVPVAPVVPVVTSPAVESKAKTEAVPTPAPVGKLSRADRKKKRGKKGRQQAVEAATGAVTVPAPQSPAEVFEESAQTAEVEPPAETIVAPAVSSEVTQAIEATPTQEIVVEDTLVQRVAPVEPVTPVEPVVEPVAPVAPVVEEIAARETPAETSLVEAEQAGAELFVEAPASSEAAADVPALAEEPALAEFVPAAPVVEEAAAPALEGSVVEEPVVEEPAGAIEPYAAEPAAAALTPPPASMEIEPAAAYVHTPVTSEIAPASAELDVDAVQAEARQLLGGQTYDRALLNVTDPMMRQMVAAEFLAALAGRNMERKERARAAFTEYGYFDESVSELRLAATPVERASAARALGLAGDRRATPHLVAALEDGASEVRRAAVEALAVVRDPEAVGPLRALLEREQRERIKLPRRLIQQAIEACAEGTRETQPVEARTIEPMAPVGLVAEPVAEPAEAARVEEYAPPVEEYAPPVGAAPEFAPVEAATVETPVEEAQATEEAEPEEVTLVTTHSVTAEPVAEEPADFIPAEHVEATAAGEASVAEEIPVFEETVGASLVEESPVEATTAAESSVVEAPPAPVEVVPPAPVAEAPLSFTVDFGDVPVAEEEAPPPVGADAQTLVADEPEFETHRAEPVAETGVQPFTGFEATREKAADEWVELDMLDAVSPIAGGQAEPPVPEPGPASYVEFEPTEVEAIEVDEEVALTPQPEGGEEPAAPAESSFAIVPVEEGSDDSYDSYAEPARTAAPASTSRTHAADKGIALFSPDDHMAVPKAIQLRLSSDVPDERAAAVTELAHVTGDDAFRVVCAGFDDPSVEVRSAAARSLYDMQDDRAEAFTRALREADPQRRRNIGAAIASSGLATEAVSRLTGESRERTYEAFSLLFLMAKAGEVAPLIRAIESHADNEVRLAVVKLLALSGQKEVLPAFRRLAVRGALPADVRSAVMEAIYQITSQTPVA